MNNPYIKHYQEINKIYPSALALKVFLGKSPLFNFKNLEHSKYSILDLGFGDGRDLKLFTDLGFKTYGCEPSEEIVNLTANKNISSNITLKVGENSCIPFENDFFDFIYASASIYYLASTKNTIQDTLREVNRCMKVGGHLIFTATTSENHYIDSAKKISEDVYQLTDPFFQQRPDQLIHVYKNSDEILRDLTLTGFDNKPFIGKFSADWFGIHESLFIVVAEKK